MELIRTEGYEDKMVQKHISQNYIFKKLVHLTNLNDDIETLITLFKEKDIVVDSALIESWLSEEGQSNFKEISENNLLAE
ncbi:DUF1456 family protein [Acinetobacter baumannii]|uniref:DUF1456 family protein n=1 Tax=Acinetobacter baumannii TaxID=470 RepID=UPI0027425EFC|nr:DUF1456 family protein [Acinetobacter baumannii]MDP7811442.1 DUF1456 family protein [Acinetobacter baumannii]